MSMQFLKFTHDMTEKHFHIYMGNSACNHQALFVFCFCIACFLLIPLHMIIRYSHAWSWRWLIMSMQFLKFAYDMTETFPYLHGEFCI